MAVYIVHIFHVLLVLLIVPIYLIKIKDSPRFQSQSKPATIIYYFINIVMLVLIIQIRIFNYPYSKKTYLDKTYENFIYVIEFDI